MPRASQAARVTSRREFLRVAGLLSLGAGLLSATKAKIQRLTWKPVAEASTRIVALRTGQADLIANIPPQLMDQVSGPDMKLERVPGILIAIMFNFAMKPFDDLKVRQALNHAVNVDEIIQFVLGGAATRLASATKPGMLGHDPELKAYPPSRAAAPFTRRIPIRRSQTRSIAPTARSIAPSVSNCSARSTGKSSRTRRGCSCTHSKIPTVCVRDCRDSKRDRIRTSSSAIGR
jgi:hypothetical protein